MAHNLSNVCRICLTEKRNMHSIYGSCNIGKCADAALDIRSQIMECSRVLINPEDELPSTICQKCLSNLHASFEFKLLCETSDRFLRDILDNPSASKVVIREKKVEVKDVEIKEEPGLDSNIGLPIKEEQDEPDDDDVTVFPELETLLRFERPKRSYIRRKPLRKHVCDKCNKVFKARKLWVTHLVNAHGAAPPSKDANSCEACGEHFPNWKELKQHQKDLGHYKKEDCSVCGKSFSKSYMPDHMRVHMGDKPFLCTQCGQSFLYQFALRKHFLYCSKAEKLLNCSYCEKRFHERGRLNEHEKMHDAILRYICELCGKGFKRKTKLIEHFKIHTNERPYKCETCAKAFRTNQQLKEHSRIHTGIRPYVCDMCPAAFTQGHCLKTHKEKLHRNEN